jgi:hypothetical protein
MNVVLDVKNIDIENIQFLNKTDNIIMDGFFTKLIYSDSNITMSGLYIHFPICIKYINNNIAFFDLNENKECIQEILEMEKNILQYYKEFHSLNNNLFFSSIKKQFFTGMIKLNSFTIFDREKGNPTFHPNNPCVLKISGIWENNGIIGITYKFLQSRGTTFPLRPPPFW